VTAYFRPATLDEALAIRATRPVEIIAGGTDVYPNRTTRAGWGRMAHPDVLDITAVPGLDRLEEGPDHWRIGCLVTWTALARAALPPLFEGLKAAATAIGGPQVQNRGTLVGNLCTASPAGDGIPNLMALDAQVEIAGPGGIRIVDMEAFFTGYRATVCGADEIVLAVRVPKRGARGRFEKLGARRYLVISIVMVAAAIEAPGGRIAHARLCVGACSPVARRLPALEARLLGEPVAAAADLVRPDDFSDLAPLDDVRASAAYRLAAAQALTRDCLAGFAESRRAA
jgi:xanthine dehydrogenase small subunit